LEDHSLAGSGKNARLFPKNNFKMSITEVVVHLPSKYEPLSSTPSTTQKINKNKMGWALLDTKCIPSLGWLQIGDMA
jgi:hypothetical protein